MICRKSRIGHGGKNEQARDCEQKKRKVRFNNCTFDPEGKCAKLLPETIAIKIVQSDFADFLLQMNHKKI